MNGFVDADDHHQQNQNTRSRGIDMAVVFAKILNQNPRNTRHSDKKFEIEVEANNHGLSSSNNNNNFPTPKSVETENDAVDWSCLRILLMKFRIMEGV